MLVAPQVEGALLMSLPSYSRPATVAGHSHFASFEQQALGAA